MSNENSTDSIHILSPYGVTKMQATYSISADELEKRIADNAVPGIPAELDRVEITQDDRGYLSVTPFWKHVDRAQGSGYGVKTRREADRLKRAIEAGAVYTNAFVTRDNGGNTYVTSNQTVMGRYLNADLKKLGF